MVETRRKLRKTAELTKVPMKIHWKGKKTREKQRIKIGEDDLSTIIRKSGRKTKQNEWHGKE